MDIILTINGNRNIPVVNVDEELVKLLENPNAEFSITLVCSPTGVEGKFPQGDEPLKTIRKVRALFIKSITPNGG